MEVQRMMRVASLVMLIIISITHTRSQNPVDQVTERFWDWMLEEFPHIQISERSETEENLDKFQDLTQQAFKRRKESVEAFLTEAQRLSSSSLPRADLIELQLLQYHLLKYIEGYRYKDFGNLNYLSLLEGPHIEMLDWLMARNFSSIEAYHIYRSKVGKLPEYVDQMIELMKRAISEGTTYHRKSVEAVIPALNEITQNLHKTSFTLPFRNIDANLAGAGLTASAIISMATEALGEMTLYISQAFRKLLVFLEDEYLPATRPDLTVYSLPNGSDYYLACLEWSLTDVVKPDTLYLLAVEYVQEIDAEIKQIIKMILNDDEAGFMSLREFVARMKESRPDLYNLTPSEAMTLYQDMIEDRIIPALSPHFNETLLKSSLNNVSAQEVVRSLKARYEILGRALSLLLPSSLYSKTSLSKYRKYRDFDYMNTVPYKFPVYKSLTEGLSLHGTDFVDKFDITADDMERLSILSNQQYYATLLAADLGIHHKQWGWDRGMKYLYAHTDLSEEECEGKLIEIITYPGQTGAGAYGKMEMDKMENMVKDKQGDDYKPANFYKSALEFGPAPLTLVRNRMERLVNDDDVTNIILDDDVIRDETAVINDDHHRRGGGASTLASSSHYITFITNAIVVTFALLVR